ncbi:hypothetical protein EYZ11_008804 [Aspergillus tanneri]|uniref:Uncharacterized protein n=1 Tax=Aspergillus tanneri TaxID=1220188 RepID=A0A4S3J9P0_9EURO|nr:hypothetical protein EYZ11_008804 [Aspergillus tanneri]
MLYIHATIITVNPDRDIITDGAVLVRENRIKDIQKTSALLGRYPDEERNNLLSGEHGERLGYPFLRINESDIGASSSSLVTILMAFARSSRLAEYLTVITIY